MIVVFFMCEEPGFRELRKETFGEVLKTSSHWNFIQNPGFLDFIAFALATRLYSMARGAASQLVDSTGHLPPGHGGATTGQGEAGETAKG